jgi:hypothetical protein
VVGPTFYGVKSAVKVTSINETVATYVATTETNGLNKDELKVSIYPNPSSELIAIQLGTLSKENMKVELLDLTGRLVKESMLIQGSTITYFETSTLHRGTYLVRITNGQHVINRKILIAE